MRSFQQLLLFLSLCFLVTEIEAILSSRWTNGTLSSYSTRTTRIGTDPGIFPTIIIPATHSSSTARSSITSSILSMSQSTSVFTRSTKVPVSTAKPTTTYDGVTIIPIITPDPSTVSAVTTRIPRETSNAMVTLKPHGPPIPFLFHCLIFCPLGDLGILIHGIGPGPGIYFLKFPPVPSLNYITIGNDNKPTPGSTKPDSPDLTKSEPSKTQNSMSEISSTTTSQCSMATVTGCLNNCIADGSTTTCSKTCSTVSGCTAKATSSATTTTAACPLGTVPADFPFGFGPDGLVPLVTGTSSKSQSLSTSTLTSTSSCIKTTATGCSHSCSSGISTTKCITTCSTTSGCSATATNSATTSTEACTFAPVPSDFPFGFGSDGLVPLVSVSATSKPEVSSLTVISKEPASTKAKSVTLTKAKPTTLAKATTKSSTPTAKTTTMAKVTTKLIPSPTPTNNAISMFCLPTYKDPTQCTCTDGTKKSTSISGECPYPLPASNPNQLIIWHHAYLSSDSGNTNVYEVSQDFDVSLPVKDLIAKSIFSMPTSDTLDTLPLSLGPFREGCVYTGTRTEAGSVACKMGEGMKCYKLWNPMGTARKRDWSFELARVVFVCSRVS